MSASILIVCGGGMVQEVYCDLDHDVCIIDMDNDGVDEEQLRRLPEGGEGCVSRWSCPANKRQAGRNWELTEEGLV